MGCCLDLRHQHAEHKARSCLARALRLGWQDFRGRKRGFLAHSQWKPRFWKVSSKISRADQDQLRSTQNSPKLSGILVKGKKHHMKSLGKIHQRSVADSTEVRPCGVQSWRFLSSRAAGVWDPGAVWPGFFSVLEQGSYVGYSTVHGYILAVYDSITFYNYILAGYLSWVYD